METQVIWVDRRSLRLRALCCCDERSSRETKISRKTRPPPTILSAQRFGPWSFAYILPCLYISHFVLDMSMKMTALVNTVNILTTNEEFTFANEEKSAWWPP